jgi:hypothetical protein
MALAHERVRRAPADPPILFEEDLLTEDQQFEAVKSIAVELNRLAHNAPMPTEEDGYMNVAVIVRSLSVLCRASVQALAQLTVAMAEHNGCNAEDDAREVQH